MFKFAPRSLELALVTQLQRYGYLAYNHDGVGTQYDGQFFWAPGAKIKKTHRKIEVK